MIKAQEPTNEFNYENAGMFMHCAPCLQKFIKSPASKKISPREAMSYEASSHPYTYPNGTRGMVVAIWCKKCHEMVWNSSHLKQIEKDDPLMKG